MTKSSRDLPYEACYIERALFLFSGKSRRLTICFRVSPALHSDDVHKLRSELLEPRSEFMLTHLNQTGQLAPVLALALLAENLTQSNHLYYFYNATL